MKTLKKIKEEKKQYILEDKQYSQEQLEDYAMENGLALQQSGEDNELIISEIINPENKQNKMSAIIDSNEKDYYEGQLELKLSSNYCNYSNTTADNFVEKMKDDESDYFTNEDITVADIDKYNNMVTKFNEYGDATSLNSDMDGEQMAEVIQNNDNLIH